LVVAKSPEMAGAVVARLARAGANVLVAAREASDLSHWIASAKGSSGTVHGMTVDVSRKEEVERVFRWVDGTLLHLDYLVDVLEEERLEGGPAGDLNAWHRELEERWVMPLLLVEAAAQRMRLRRSGHLLQVAIQTRTNLGGAAESSQTVGAYGQPVWSTLREMLEARRELFRRDGVRLSILEVEGELGACAWAPGGGRSAAPGSPGEAASGGGMPPPAHVVPSAPTASLGYASLSASRNLQPWAGCPSPDEVAAAVEFCMGHPRGAVVEVLRLSAPCSAAPCSGSGSRAG
jgi:NAD(P)-dependent dehydrogenase (short-subunit alcohol dehydrogenase family)